LIIGGIVSEEPKKEFKQEYLEEKLHAISEKLGDAYGEPFLRELISRMERTVAHFNEEVDVMVSTVKNNSKKRRKFLAEKRGEEFNENSDEEILSSKTTDSSELEDRGDKEASKESTNEDAEPKKKRFSLFKRKKKS
tara:strand:+ start:72 stop:482 length:411 start_codon:yes stop_codon:yes gene_type:complete